LHREFLAEIGAAQKRDDCCNAAAFWCAAHFSVSLRQHHEICKQFHASKKVPPLANKILCTPRGST
jgi:hypothetical protein